MNQPYAKPVPTVDDLNRPFWQGCLNNRLMLQTCSACGHVRYPIAAYCPECLSEDAIWTPMSGRGAVFSSIVFHQVYHPAFKDDVPYNVSLIQLDEGPRMVSNVVGIPPEAVKVGDRVEVLFDQVTDGLCIPRFRPAATA